MIDWIKVRKERRIKLVHVHEQDVEDYLLISKLPDAKIVSTFDFPEHWTVGGVTYNPSCQEFVFIVMSPDFDPVLIGSFPETILADRHVVEITRKAVVSA